MKQHWFLKNFFKMTQNIWSILKCLEHFEMAQNFLNYFGTFTNVSNILKWLRIFLIILKYLYMFANTMKCYFSNLEQ